MSDLAELLERVKAATGPDRELDADLAQTIEGVEIQWRQANGTMEMYPVQRYPSTTHSAGFGIGPVPNYTASIDAALALTERVLPGWWVHGMGRYPSHGLWWVTLYNLDDKAATEIEDRDAAPPRHTRRHPYRPHCEGRSMTGHCFEAHFAQIKHLLKGEVKIVPVDKRVFAQWQLRREK